MFRLDRHSRRDCPRAERSRHPALRARISPAPFLLAIPAVIWLLLRSAPKPSRIAYPCQQAALGSAWLGLGIPLAPLVHRALAGRTAGRRAALLVLLAILGLAGFSDTREDAMAGGSASAIARPEAPQAPADYTAEIFLVEDAGGPEGDHHTGVDHLIACMGANGTKFYRSSATGPEAGPEGVVGADDVVLIKVNQQWGARGGTNTDVLAGLIARIVEHPDGFVGEVVVVENTQGQGTLDWSSSNAEDTGQSTLDVVNRFADQGRPVGAVLWDAFRLMAVNEYSAGDLRDGYVVGPYRPETQIAVSYPKFRTPAGNYVSLAHGLWNPDSATYDSTRLTFLNLPVLKCHGAVYGVTASVKNQVGTMTTALATNTHAAVRTGGLGSFLAQVRMPDLNVLDCIYVLARPDRGPGCSYADATRLGKLAASVDPVALDLWATANLLVPAMIANGYTSYPMQDPFDPASDFRTYLDAATRELLAAGLAVTNDLGQIEARVCSSVIGRDPVEVSGARRSTHPNPSGGGVTFRFAPDRSGSARLDVFDPSGRLRRTLHASIQAGATHEIRWDARDGAGRLLPPGTYAYRLSGAGRPLTGKLTLAR